MGTAEKSAIGNDYRLTRRRPMNTPIKYTPRRLAASALLIAAASGFAGVCSAADTNPLQALVKYGDLNVSSSEGAAALYTRIHAAAEQVCRPLDNRDMAFKKLKEACVSTAIADAVAKVDQPALFSVYSAKSGISKPIMLVAR
jgi:UrcA family protein